MNARRLQYAQIVSVALALAMFEGCEHFRHALREHDPDVARSSAETKAKDGITGTASETETSKVLDVQSDPKKPSPFFKSSRLSGALSDQGRDIERDLGIH